MYPHRIRLRGPWELTCGRHPPVCVNLPATWESLNPDNLTDGIRLTRRFGSPRELDSFESVWLTVSELGGTAGEWRLNGEPLGSVAGPQNDVEFEITRLLRPRNVLEVMARAGTPGRPVWGETAIEIRGEYSLRDVSIRGGVVSGAAVGPAGNGLELYVLHGGRTVLYERVGADPAGRRFAFAVAAAPCNPQHPEWRVELVEGANRWFTVDVEPPAAAVR